VTRKEDNGLEGMWMVTSCSRGWCRARRA
jgi:hypothetical protein